MSDQNLDTQSSVGYSHIFGWPVITADIDGNGYKDLVTFPSNFAQAVHMSPNVWTNNNGQFTANDAVISGSPSYQFYRDFVSADFNNDGRMDYIMADTGWELENRNPEYFYGNAPGLYVGSDQGLVWQSSESWFSTTGNPKSFHHIASTADYDDDGDMDVAMAAFWNFRLLNNDGSGRFTDRGDLLPSKFNNHEYAASGTTFIKLGGSYALVAGAYYQQGQLDPVVLTQSGGRFVESFSLDRPNLNGREQDYGAVDMYNQDINGDGLEDLLITWETENPSNPQAARYSDLSNTLVTVWFQDRQGGLYTDNQVYKMATWTAGATLNFVDFNGDGHLDFYSTAHGIHPKKINSLIWINDGNGSFSNAKSLFSITEGFSKDYLVSPYFFDANNDGALDIVAMRPVFARPATQTVGQELRVWLSSGAGNNDSGSDTGNDAPAPRAVKATNGNDTLVGTANSDRLDGKKGNDTLTGGDGADYFVFSKKPNAVNNFDRITDYEIGQDHVVLSSKVFKSEDYLSITDNTLYFNNTVVVELVGIETMDQLQIDWI